MIHPDLPDFLSVRLWNSVIRKPKFWRWAKLTVNTERVNYQEVLQSPLVNLVPEIIIYDPSDHIFGQKVHNDVL